MTKPYTIHNDTSEEAGTSECWTIEEENMYCSFDNLYDAHLVANAPVMLAELKTLKECFEQALNGTWDKSDEGFQDMLQNVNKVINEIEQGGSV